MRNAMSLSEAVTFLDLMGTVIPTYLRDSGVRGERYESMGDPVAVWLVSVTCGVSARTDDYMIELVHADGRVESVYTPYAVAGFLSEFDHGMHPDLDAAVQQRYAA